MILLQVKMQMMMRQMRTSLTYGNDDQQYDDKCDYDDADDEKYDKDCDAYDEGDDDDKSGYKETSKW